MQIQRIVHLADIHFRNIQRHTEFRAICENFYSQMKKIQPDRIVIAGDIVHSRNQISPELVNIVSWFLGNCAKLCGKLIIIAGNHDIVEQNTQRMDALTPIINTLEMDNIYYYDTSAVHMDDNVAWIVYSIYDAHMAPKYDLQTIKSKLKIGLFHGPIVGATNNLGFTFAHGSDLEKFNVCDLTLCGDIHKRQVMKTTAGVEVIYPGSFIQQNFEETVSNHGFNLVTIGEDNKYSYKFTDLDNPVKYLNFKINDYEDIENGEELLTNA